MDELARRPDDPDAIDRDPARMPDPDGEPDPDHGSDEGMMRFPGEEAPEVVGSGSETTRAEAPDATGSLEESS